jgi:starvation-inducible outer membrane lipoprotein
MIKTSLILLAALVCSGCSTIDDAINDAVNDTLSGDVTAETIQLKERALIINNVSLSACVAIKNGLVDAKGLKNAETLVTEIGVTCKTYHKKAGDPTDIDAQCVEESLAEWLDQGDNEKITDLKSAQGDKACVIGFDL